MTSLSDAFLVRIDGKDIAVHQARVSAVPHNQVWPGYQRPIGQTELAAFAYWDMAGTVTVDIVPTKAVETVTIRPRSLGINPTVEHNHIRFSLEAPAYITVEVNGYHNALHLFADHPETESPDPQDPNVIYFGPGEHEVEQIRPLSGQTVYIAAGAAVYSTIQARNASDIRILGRGILDGSRVKRTHQWYQELDETDEEPFGALALYECDNVEIDGIVIRDPHVYNVSLFACLDAKVSRVKIIGSWRYNSDGIDLINSSNVVIERCFVRSFDDSIVLTGLPSHRGCRCGHLPCNNVTVRDCVVWNDWGRALELGAACSAPEIRNVHFLNCDIIRATGAALDVQNVGRAWVRDITFENIRVELDNCPPRPQYQRSRDEVYTHDPNDEYCPQLCVVEIGESMYTRDDEHGHVRNVLFKDIVATGKANPPSYIKGFDANHRVEDVAFENLVIEGRTATDRHSAYLAVRDHASSPTFRPGTAEQPPQRDAVTRAR